MKRVLKLKERDRLKESMKNGKDELVLVFFIYLFFMFVTQRSAVDSSYLDVRSRREEQ